MEAEKGEEAPHSKSDHFEEEEVGHDPNSECPPLIDLWYDTNSHFLVVPVTTHLLCWAMFGCP